MNKETRNCGNCIVYGNLAVCKKGRKIKSYDLEWLEIDKSATLYQGCKDCPFYEEMRDGR